MTLLILFDIDGTLLRAGDPVHAEAMRRALADVVGESVDLTGIPLAGMLDRQIARHVLLRQGFTEEDINALLPLVMARMVTYYRREVQPGHRRSWVLPGVRALLPYLWQQRHLPGVLTGNASGVARTKLAAAELDRWLPFGAYGDQADERSTLVEHAWRAVRERYALKIAPNRTVLIGDTPHDVAAALTSGARVLAVATGRFGAEELYAAGAHCVLPNLGDTNQVMLCLERLAARP